MDVFTFVAILALVALCARLCRWLRGRHAVSGPIVQKRAKETRSGCVIDARNRSTRICTGKATNSGHLQYSLLVTRERPAAVVRAQALLEDNYKSATLDVHEGMMEDGVQPTVANVQVAIVLLSCRDLRPQFRDHVFDSASDIWCVEHVFTRAASEVDNVLMESLFDDIPQVVREQWKTYRVFAMSSAGCGKTTLFTKVVPLHCAGP